MRLWHDTFSDLLECEHETVLESRNSCAIHHCVFLFLSSNILYYCDTNVNHLDLIYTQNFELDLKLPSLQCFELI